MRVMMMSEDWTVSFSFLKPMILTCLFVTFGIQGSLEVSVASSSENRDLEYPVASSSSSSIPSSSSLGNYSFPSFPDSPGNFSLDLLDSLCSSLLFFHFLLFSSSSPLLLLFFSLDSYFLPSYIIVTQDPSSSLTSSFV